MAGRSAMKSMWQSDVLRKESSIGFCANLRRDYAIQEVLESSMGAPGGTMDGTDPVNLMLYRAKMLPPNSMDRAFLQALYKANQNENWIGPHARLDPVEEKFDEQNIIFHTKILCFSSLRPKF